ncbi:MAG: SpoIVB peptidase S55 domain-containing protein [Vicinamibacterales bacterium]
MPRLRGLALLCALALLSGASLPAASRVFPVDDIRPGMTAEGRTVFAGDRLEPFTVHILGVLKNVMGPQRTLVLARLEGGPLAQTGVIAGMSGSPVYIDGRLVGAVAYSLGAFSREPIAGITPIGEMVADAALDAPRRRAAAARIPRGAGTDDPVADAREAFAALAPFVRSPADAQPLGGTLPGLAATGAMLRPIATPLGLGGFSASTVAPLETLFQQSGFLPSMAGAAATADPGPRAAAPLRPGDPVGITMVSGDLEIGATGTVTEIDGDRVYAFGHPFYNLGPTAFPMTRAWVHAILPSLQSSLKIATTGAVIGTISQDRATTIAGRLGAGPTQIPVSLTLDAAGTTRTFRMQVARDQLFTPLMTYLSVVETLTSYQRQMGTSTYAVTGRIALTGRGEIAIDDIYTGDQAPAGAGNAVMGPLNALLRNVHEDVAIDSVTLRATASEDTRSAVLERVSVDRASVRPGDTVPVTIHARTYRGGTLTRTVPIRIPVQAKGAVSILVADAVRTVQADPRDTAPAQMQSLSQVLTALRSVRRANRFYVRLVAPEAGAVVRGESLQSLPASVIAVMEGDRQGGSFRGLGAALTGDWEAAFDYAVSGSRTITIPVD